MDLSWTSIVGRVPFTNEENSRHSYSSEIFLDMELNGYDKNKN